MSLYQAGHGFDDRAVGPHQRDSMLQISVEYSDSDGPQYRRPTAASSDSSLPPRILQCARLLG